MGSERVTPPTLKEIFKSVFPYYLSIGMTYDLFWNGDVCLVSDYRKADEICTRRKEQEMWKQGAYFYEALCDASPILHAFAKSGTKPIPYVERPYPSTAKEARERNAQEEEKRMERMQAMFNAYAIGLNQQLKEAGNGRDN